LKGDVKNERYYDQWNDVWLTLNGTDLFSEEIAHDDFMENISKIKDDDEGDDAADEIVLLHHGEWY